MPANPDAPKSAPMTSFGLIGYPLSHSFSRGYFTEKFSALGLADSYRYLNFEIRDAAELRDIIRDHPDLRGINVTIPHKQAVIPLLDEVESTAARIGAVNTILVRGDKTTGFNTDHSAFRDDLLEQLAEQGRSTGLRGTSALILGTGGASLAVREALAGLGVHTLFVSRRAGEDRITYDRVNRAVLNEHHLIVNTTPVGTDPDRTAAPDLPYDDLSPEHFCYDLIYNPAETQFLREARRRGAGAANGLGMLHKQAEAAWLIWTGE